MTGRRIVIGGTDLTDHIRTLVDQAPALSGEQADRLRTLFAAARRTSRPQRPTRGRHVRRPAHTGDAA
jgi:hypothetical protein